MRQRRPNLTQMAAALALQVPGLVPEHLRAKSEKAILGALDFHHDPIPFADGGDCSPQNLTAMLREEHKRITAKVTVPTIAKNKRIRKKNQKHLDALARKAGYETDPFVDAKTENLPGRKIGLWTRVDRGALKKLGFVEVPRGKRQWPKASFPGHRKFDGTAVWKKKTSAKD